MPQGGGFDRVGAPLLLFAANACADREHQASRAACADNRVVRTRRTVHEVPLSKPPLLALDDEKRFARQHEEILLVGFPVVHRHRFARPKKREIDPELLEVGVALVRPLEVAQRSTTRALPPLRFKCVENKPTIPLWHKATVGLYKLNRS